MLPNQDTIPTVTLFLVDVLFLFIPVVSLFSSITLFVRIFCDSNELDFEVLNSSLLINSSIDDVINFIQRLFMKRWWRSNDRGDGGRGSGGFVAGFVFINL